MNLTNSLGKAMMFAMVLCFTTSALFAQVQGRKTADPKTQPKGQLSPYGKIETNWYKLGWFVDANFGTRILGATSSSVDLAPGFNTNFSIGFMVTDRIGLRGRYDFNSFKFTPGFNGQDVSKGRMHSASIEAITDILPLAQGTKIRDWRIGLHGGFGLSTYRNVDYAEFREEVWSWDDPALKGNDDMIHMIVGLMPQYHINGRWSLNLDISAFFLFKQDMTFDRFNNEKLNGVGSVMTASFGVSFRP